MVKVTGRPVPRPTPVGECPGSANANVNGDGRAMLGRGYGSEVP